MNVASCLSSYSKWVGGLCSGLKNSKIWPHVAPACELACMATNVACKVLETPSSVTLALNVPVRAFSILIHPQGSSRKVFDIAALALFTSFAVLDNSGSALFLGQYLVLALDIIHPLVEVCYQAHKSERKIPQEIPLETLLKRVPDVKSRIGATQFLGISEQEAKDPTIVREHYMSPVCEYKRRLSRNQRHQSIIVRSWVTQLISYYQEAYRTLGGDPKDDDEKPYGDPD